jgi:sec-independent protein translocase protein TatA
MFSGIGFNELLVILVIVLILFGAGRLPSVFGQFGKGIKAFRDAQKEDPLDVTTAEQDKPKLEESARELDLEKDKSRSHVG